MPSRAGESRSAPGIPGKAVGEGRCPWVEPVYAQRVFAAASSIGQMKPKPLERCGLECGADLITIHAHDLQSAFTVPRLRRPVGQQERKVGSVDLAGKVEIRGMARGAPGGEQHAQVDAVDDGIAADVATHGVRD